MTTRLDFLANFPQNQAANALLATPYPNPNTFDNVFLAHLKEDSLKLAKTFAKNHATSFEYSHAEFLSLFCTLFSHHYHILLSPSLSQQSFYAGKQFQALIPNGLSFLPLNQNGITESLSCNVPKSQKIAIFLPIINQDILSCNPIESLIDEALQLSQNALIFCDISLFASQLTQEGLAFLHTLAHPQVFFLCNGEHIGLMRKSAFILSDITAHNHAINDYYNTQLLCPNLFKAAMKALEDILAIPPQEESKEAFFEQLTSHLKEHISLFSPLHLSAKNALALRFKHIKARLFIQSLQIAGIYAINGSDCLFGHAKPSFVLSHMGYEEHICRELLSVSYREITDIPALSANIANAYLQLAQFHT